MSQNYTWKEIKDKVNTELDIAVLLDEIFEKKLWHPDAPVNEFLKNGEIDFEFNVKTAYTMVTCPFHHGETSSKSANSTFYYLEDKETTKGNQLMCKTGGCASGGKMLTPIHLYMILVKNVAPDLLFDATDEYKETVKELASMIGITGWSYQTRSLSPEEILEFRKQKIRQEVCEIYATEFMKNNKWARKAREFFFYERGFGQLGFSARSLIRKVKIGYAGGKYGTKFIYYILKKRGYTDEELLHAGVVQYKKLYDKETKKSTQTDEIIDFLTNRLTIPYHKGSKIDHGYGRRLDFKDELEKMYSKMTEEQIKKHKGGKHLRFGGGVDEPINFQEAKKYESIIVVEGEMDYLTFKALGFNNVIAVGGTNGVDKHDIELLKYHREKSNRTICNTILLCFDEDGPGQEAMKKLGAGFLEEGFDVRVVRLVEGDPNDYLVKYGKKAQGMLQELLDSSVTFEAFRVLGVFKQAKLVTNADIRGALIKSREFLANINAAELLFIGADIIDCVNEQRSEGAKIPLEWLLHAWNIVPNTAVLQPKGFENAILKPWIMITDDEVRYEVLVSNGTLDNVVFVPDMTTFIQKIKNETHIKNIAFDMKLSKENREQLLTALADFKFQVFTGDTIEQIRTASKYDLIAMFRKLPKGDEKAS